MIDYDSFLFCTLGTFFCNARHRERVITSVILFCDLAAFFPLSIFNFVGFRHSISVLFWEGADKATL